MNAPMLSVIIPLYCGGRFIKDIFATVKSQGLAKEDYELILVDDASPDDCVKTVKEEIALNPDVDAHIICHETNKRQGGARNTGIREAKGQYIVFMDQDDGYFAGALKNIRERIVQEDSYPDIVAVDYSNSKDGAVEEKTNYSNDTNLMSGLQYMQTQEVPWMPWCYLYRREYIQDKGFVFQENACFEDKDFVIRATVNAATIKFYPVKLVIHKVWTGQQSEVGNDFRRIHDLFWISYRTRQVAEEIQNDDATKTAVLNHHRFAHKENIKKYLWRLPYKQQIEILTKFPAYMPSKSLLLDFSVKHPKLLAITLQLAKIPLLGSSAVYRKLRKR